MFRRFLLASICASALLGSADAAPIVTNGNFATGNLNGWTTTEAPGPSGSENPVGYPPAVVLTGNAPCCFGEAVPVDSLNGGSPYAVYFVDDVEHQTLSQTVFLQAGSYKLGFDAYNPFNGFANANDAMFSGMIAGVTLASYTVHNSGPGGWAQYDGVATILTSGNYLISFSFVPNGVPAADVLVDNVFIDPSSTSGTPIGVPEPLTLSIFGASLAGAAAAMRRRRKANKTA